MIIGINGFKGVGKDTAADYFNERHNFVKMPFAFRLKSAVCALFAISMADVEKWKDPKLAIEVHINDRLGDDVADYLTWRELLQRFGTEMGRHQFGQDFWVDLLMNSLDHDVDYVIPDARFENELKAIKNRNGKNIRIERIGYESDGHYSEKEPPLDLIDAFFYNDERISDLYTQLESWYQHVTQ